MKVRTLIFLGLAVAAIAASSSSLGQQGGPRKFVSSDGGSGGTTGSTGLTAEYYDNADQTQHKVTETDANALSFPPTGITIPLSDAVTTGNGFSAVWSGYITPTVSGSISWKCPYTTNGTGPVNYQVEISDSQQFFTFGVHQNPLAVVDPAGTLTTFTAGQTYKIWITLSSWNTGTAQSLNLKWLLPGGTSYVSVPNSALAPAVVTSIPGGPQVMATGSQRLSCFWTGDSAAAGYNVYRAAAAGAEDYSSHVNGSLVTSPTYSGGLDYVYSDTSALQLGQEYFYTVKAAYNNSVLGRYTESSPSGEDSDLSASSGIPWDGSDVAAVAGAIRNAYASTPVDVSGTMRAMGPDGRIFDEAVGYVQVPDALGVNGNVVALQGGGSLSLGPFPDIVPTGNTLPNEGSGPYRGVYSNKLSGYTGVTGEWYLPQSPYASLGRYDTLTGAYDPALAASPDSICLMTDSSTADGTKALDAGVTYYSNGSGLDVWSGFMGATHLKVKVNLPHHTISGGQYVTVSYFSRAVAASSRQKSAPCVLTIAPMFDQAVVLTGYSDFRNSDSLCLKRVASIAQPKQNPTVKAQGWYKLGNGQGSYLSGAEWHQGILYNSSGGTVTWGVGQTLGQGSFPVNAGLVNWYADGPYYDEVSIFFDLR